MDRKIHEEARHNGDNSAYAKAPGHPPSHKARQDHPIGNGRHEHGLDTPLELRGIKGGGHVRISVGDHAHHDEPGNDEGHVVETPHLPDPTADKGSEDQKVQHHADRRRYQGLGPNAQKATDFLKHDGAKGDPGGA